LFVFVIDIQKKFRNFQQKDQLKSLREQIQQEIEHHQEQAKQHENVIERHKQRIAEIEAEEKRVE
uniref:DUF3552 domain-containing protein n=1 Tax=Anisakis simplex TaxID=6269 RepID=A0A0M3J310_ANISI